MTEYVSWYLHKVEAKASFGHACMELSNITGCAKAGRIETRTYLAGKHWPACRKAREHETHVLLVVPGHSTVGTTITEAERSPSCLS